MIYSSSSNRPLGLTTASSRTPSRPLLLRPPPEAPSARLLLRRLRQIHLLSHAGPAGPHRHCGSPCRSTTTTNTTSSIAVPLLSTGRGSSSWCETLSPATSAPLPFPGHSMTSTSSTGRCYELTATKATCNAGTTRALLR